MTQTDDSNTAANPDFAHGLAYLKSQIKSLPQQPGVYRMYDSADNCLYVGKARHLARRVTSYTQPNRLSSRLMQMVGLTRRLEITVTASEVEALLLEANLIKKNRPRYNILLKDDKSFAYILISGDHPFPQMLKHRGARKRKGQYYGPFASAGAVNKTLTSLSRAFLLRNCSDSYYSARTRPCLQYQIKRCTAPCVGLVSEADYAEQVAAAAAFLSGASDQVQRDYAQAMQQASDCLDFENAAVWRNRIRALTAIQASQDMNLQGLGDADIIALSQQGGRSSIQIFFVRAGTNFGNASYFPQHQAQSGPDEILAAFMGQFYDERPAPGLILTSVKPAESDLLAQALSAASNHRTVISVPQRGTRRQLMTMALRNAEEALARQLSQTASQARLLEQLADCFDLARPPERIEIYDNSHIQGRNAVGAMVVAGRDGFVKSAYRTFNIRTDGQHGTQTGDDFAMMRQMIFRRFERALKEDPQRQLASWPALLLIDGGRGQLSAVSDVLNDLGLGADIAVVAISKGPDRNAGKEQFHMADRQSFSLPDTSPSLHFLQRLRDEAHRFAIGTHRARRKKQALTSPLDDVPGIGSKRKKALLAHFGSARAVSRAGIRDLRAVDGISLSTATAIYDWFHPAQR